jgi:hypothetical protein
MVRQVSAGRLRWPRKDRILFKREYRERVALAAVLAALSAVPISIGLATSQRIMHFLWLGIGLLLWAIGIALLVPDQAE